MSKTLKDKILDHCETIVNHRLAFTPRGNRYILAANEIAADLFLEDDIEAVIEISRAIEKSEYNRDSLLGGNDGHPEIDEMLDTIFKIWARKKFERAESCFK